ncbi:hypothetical protein O181_080712 [Austropuccinia psidii MF-1]|uniref:Uncharacterized protein n=1 Tax=Austropuccinia psidii MF-1 TaxID=1389203 RepID=A0A9Q3FM52_9BASI|nr:hypothetical protein [Austropuccinia psidii MF-1]
MASIGAYEYMKVDMILSNHLTLLCESYNHYVHYLMVIKHRSEISDLERTECHNANSVQTRRRNLQNVRKSYALTHNFPKRYLDILDNIDVHSDNEYLPHEQVFAIKTLPFRSENANAFFQHLDCCIHERNCQFRPNYQFCKRIRPEVPIISTVRGTPKNLPIDFYKPKYFNKLTPDKRWRAANSSQVAFLPANSYVTDEMVLPGMQMPDKAFSNKHWATLTAQYDISHQIDSSAIISDSESQNSNDEEPTINQHAKKEKEVFYDAIDANNIPDTRELDKSLVVAMDQAYMRDDAGPSNSEPSM